MQHNALQLPAYAHRRWQGLPAALYTQTGCQVVATPASCVTAACGMEQLH